MKNAIPAVIFDEELQIEACRFFQPFPNHFHEHYVIGLVEDGRRGFSCKNREYLLEKGAVMLLNPGDNHSCEKAGEETLDYRGLNIPKEVMAEVFRDADRKDSQGLPRFMQNVVYDQEAASYLRKLHSCIMEGSKELEKEELFLLLVSTLLQQYGESSGCCLPECRKEIEQTCRFMDQHFAERIRLEQLCRCAGLSKSTLLRAFTKEKGVTPYRYLEAVRINKAKKLLEEGASPGEAALATGFSDQSHFTNYFTRFIGLAPGAYRDILQEKRQKKETRTAEKNEAKDDSNGA